MSDKLKFVEWAAPDRQKLTFILNHMYCCGVMESEVTRECADHPEPFDCPDHILYYSKQLNEYGIIIHDGGSSYSVINYCPWCGSKLPRAKEQDE